MRYMWMLVLVSLTVTAWAEAYRLGPQDVITVTVMRHPEYSGEFTIPPDGAIALPGTGMISVARCTLDDVAVAIRDRLKSTLRVPEISVTLKTSRTQQLYVLGDVSKPGVYTWQAGWRLTEALAAAGGMAADPGECMVTVLRESGERVSIPLKTALHTEQDANLSLAPGDVVSVEAMERYPVYVTGAVKQPGMYKLKAGEGPVEAMVMAGGVLENAATGKAQILRATGERETVDLKAIIANNTGTAPRKLAAGDVLVIPESTARIAVLGFVKQPGYYPIREGETLRLTDALGLAIGADQRASIKTVAVLRTTNGQQERLLFDMRKFLTMGDAAQNPVLQAGDIVYVPETGKPNWNTIFQGLGSVSTMLLLL